MKKRRLIVRHGRKMAAAACGLLMGAALLQSCSDELLQGQPGWLGNSIYERLQNDPDGQKYTYLLRLADDLGQTEVLSHTGSKTIFAADDAAFQRWFENNKWGVSRYEDLSLAQKTMLLNTAMVNNAYLIELLSNAAGNPPTKGASMRRLTATTIYDSVPSIDPLKMPATTAWKKAQTNGKPVKMFMDATARPIIHLLPEFMRVNGFTNADIEKLSNGKSNSVNVSWINGVEVTDENITCKNGYIHKVADVLEPVDNMAEILRQHDNMSIWSNLIDRFSAPYYVRSQSLEYNRLYDANDSVYALRYFSNISAGGAANDELPDGITKPSALLLFDPGWNQYIYRKDGVDYHYDAAAMMVPSNQALTDWWDKGGGSALKAQFGSWDNVPDDVLADLLNNNLLDNFVNTIPSKFGSIVDDAQVPMNVQPENVDSCFTGCNGMVYLTNKVFAPSSYASVAFPAKIHTSTLNVINWAIENLDGGAFKSFLTSMESTYSLLLPTNTAMLTYVDPTLYGSNTGLLYEFYYDNDSTLAVSNRLKANRYEITKNEEGNWVRRNVPLQVEASQTIIQNRLKDLLNSLIIVGALKDDQEYYMTRGGSHVRILNPILKKDPSQPAVNFNMTVAGGYQLEGNNVPVVLPDTLLENNKPVQVIEVFDQTKETNGIGNGMSYELGSSVPMSSTNSVYSLLRDNAEFAEFYNLLNSANLFQADLSGTSSEGEITAKPNKGHQNMSLFDGFNYTVYVPTNDVILDLQARHYLPTAADLAGANAAKYGDATKANKAREAMREIIRDFIKYHVQDNAVFIKGDKVQGASYESSKVNPANNRFYALRVNANNEGLEVWGLYRMDENGRPVAAVDADGNPLAGQQMKVDTASGQYNLMAREFWNQGPNAAASQDNQNKRIYSSSDAVVHLIDGALFFSPDQLQDWETVVNAQINQ